ncbi:MAG: hypothetical protein JJU03_06865 [Idiomarina sp.]|nr:hypothetical protein [Idiomarina sp.]
MKKTNIILGGLLPSLFISPVIAADEIASAVRDSAVTLNLRYRLEHVDQSDRDNALASTLRSRLGVTSGVAYGWRGLVEVDNVTVIGNDLYNNTRNNRTNYATVADPKGTDINQALLRYTGTDGMQIDLGRQRINQLNQRFIGGVGWRQNEQTFSGYRLQQQWQNGVYIDLSRLHNVHRIFGPRGSAAEQRGEFFNVLAGLKQDPLQLSVFYHDFDFRDWAPMSSLTYGAQLEYQGQVSQTFSWTLQLVAARQTDAHNNPHSFSHTYQRFALDSDYKQLHVKVGIERLAGDGVTGFQTPLATLHAFQGFSDMFLSTPVDGIRDYFTQVAIPIQGLRVSFGAHYFSSDHQTRKYGHEVNITVSQPLNERLSLLYKGAYYDAADHGVDTGKLWLMASYQL